MDSSPAPAASGEITSGVLRRWMQNADRWKCCLYMIGVGCGAVHEDISSAHGESGMVSVVNVLVEVQCAQCVACVASVTAMVW